MKTALGLGAIMLPMLPRPLPIPRLGTLLLLEEESGGCPPSAACPWGLSCTALGWRAPRAGGGCRGGQLPSAWSSGASPQAGQWQAF